MKETIKKVNVKHITTIKPRYERKPYQGFLKVKLPPPATPKCEEDQGVMFILDMLDRSLREALAVWRPRYHEVKLIAEDAWKAHKAKNYTEADRLVALAKEIATLNAPERPDFFTSKNSRVVWKNVAQHQPDDIGGSELDRWDIKKFLTRHCAEGKILEAFAGFNSHVDSTLFNEVIALDYCKEMLEKYSHPHRTRIQCNLNNVNRNNQIGIFNEEHFDFITVCFGYKYPRSITNVFREFQRILKTGGKLLMVEHEFMGYADLTQREKIDHDQCRRFLTKAGFSKVSVKDLSLFVVNRNYSHAKEMIFIEAQK